MIETLIIADDLTGSADTGVKFAQNCPVKLVGLDKSAFPLNSATLTINTETRNEAPERILEILARIKPALGGQRPKLIYKKIDSCLRGFVGLEIAYMLKAFDLSCALVAPAYPEFGRVTFRGIHMVGGRPVHTTESSHDPLRPVLDSRLKRIIGLDNDLPVETLEIDTIRRGPEAIGERLEYLLAKTERFLLACDGETDHDLEALARGAAPFSDKILFSGSAGLAGALSELLSDQMHSWLEEQFHPPSPQPPILFLGGSASRTLHRQFGVLAQEHHGDLVTLDLRSLFEGRGQTIPALSPGRPLILTLPMPSPNPEIMARFPSQQIIEKFGLLAADLIKNRQYQTIFVSGGDTARETLRALEPGDLWIRSEICPGLVFLSAGRLSILTKSGGFGPPDLLSNLYRNLLSEEWDPKRHR
ncbi:MAG: hypothetical protein LBL95_07085 [Deltaproteobacteria bacterium]|jgi:uncharacterized protein YgbK (DUF1537 family)|nr:hypothetical protein [Deltaproteobacteria bacterium]